MTSAIIHETINENFPVAGRDNDTQTFRDNFDAIKKGLRTAKDEITDLQNNAARTDVGNNFNNNTIENAVLLNNRSSFLDKGTILNADTIDYEHGNYQKVKYSANVTVGWLNFPDDTFSPKGVGKVTLEIYSTGSLQTISLDQSNGIKYYLGNWKQGWGNLSFTVESDSNPVILEVWSHTSNEFYINYVGTFTKI